MLYRRISSALSVVVACYVLTTASARAEPMPDFVPPGALITGVLQDDAEKTAPSDPTDPQPPSAGDPTTLAPTPIHTTAPQPVQPLKDIASELAVLAQQVDALDSAIGDQPRDDDFLARSRPKIEAISKAAGDTISKLEPRLKDIESQVEKLGPKPKDGEAPETAQIASERMELRKKQAEITGAIKAAELLRERTGQLAARVQSLRQGLFTAIVLARGPSPLSPSLWADVFTELPAGGRQLVSILSQWWTVLSGQWLMALAILVLAVAAYSLLRGATTHLRVRGLMQIAADEDRPTFFKRATTALWVAASLMLPAVACAAIFIFGLDAAGLLPIEVRRLARVCLLALVIILAVWALSHAILQPLRPAWRLFDVPAQPAQRLTTIFTLMAVVYGIDLILQELMPAVFLPRPVLIAEAALATLAFAVLLFAFVRTPLTNKAVEATTSTDASPWHIMMPRWLKWPALALALGVTVAALMGYVALGRFVVGQVIVAGCLVALGMLLLLAVRALANQQGSIADRPLERALRTHLKLEQSQAQLLTRTTSLAVQAALPFAALPVLFMSWGYSLTDAIAWLKSLFFGFQVGQFRISLVELCIAAGLFVAILFLTRLAQRWITTRLMQPGRMDHGVANSIQTAVGYLGVVAATLAAVSYAGFDITNLAIVAGALSIGIGFGLQSIVNNFVSGLIILFERPIKVGDWVSVNNYEGHVRRISVRSTEIETFDRTNVIVPNSEFISNAVVNLTHRNALGRVIIPVGVSYQADPEFVQDLLLRVAQDCPLVLGVPAPSVAFEDFGASSLDFTVRAYIEDVNNRLSVASDLRIRIFKALAAANVEIPYPQQDVHMRDLDPVRTVLQQLALERTTRAQSDNGDPSS